MVQDPKRELVPIVGAGPFETPIAVGCLGLCILPGELVSRSRIRLVLQGGSELDIPLEPGAYEKLLFVLREPVLEQARRDGRIP